MSKSIFKNAQTAPAPSGKTLMYSEVNYRVDSNKIKLIQKFLNVQQDGQWGPLSAQAFSNWAKSKGIATNGYVIESKDWKTLETAANLPIDMY